MAGAAAVLPDVELDPERALWVPGQRRIFDLGGIRPAEVRQLNTFLLSDLIAQEALKVLQNSLALARIVNRDYARTFDHTADAVGYAVKVKWPPRFGDPVVLRPGEDLVTIERTR